MSTQRVLKRFTISSIPADKSAGHFAEKAKRTLRKKIKKPALRSSSDEKNAGEVVSALPIASTREDVRKNRNPLGNHRHVPSASCRPQTKRRPQTLPADQPASPDADLFDDVSSVHCRNIHLPDEERGYKIFAERSRAILKLFAKKKIFCGVKNEKVFFASEKTRRKKLFSLS